MPLIAAFLWNKSPHHSISTLIIDDETMKILSPAKVEFPPNKFFRFRSETKKIIQDFYQSIEKYHRDYNKPVTIEFKIVFPESGLFYLFPAKESTFVFKTFMKNFQRVKKKVKSIKIMPQLRKRLSGKPLKKFKKELRTMYLVSRKRGAGFEYHLWTVALHATQSTYERKLKRVRNKLLATMWNKPF